MVQNIFFKFAAIWKFNNSATFSSLALGILTQFFAWVAFVLLSHPISCLRIGPKMTMSCNGRVTGWQVGISRCPPESIPYLWTNKKWNWFLFFNFPNNMTRLFSDLWLLYGIRKLNCFLLLFYNHLSFPTTKHVNQQPIGCNFLA